MYYSSLLLLLIGILSYNFFKYLRFIKFLINSFKYYNII